MRKHLLSILSVVLGIVLSFFAVNCYAFPDLSGSYPPFQGGPITAPFLEPRDDHLHEGIDIGMDGQKMYAPFKGTATLESDPDGFGWYVRFEIDPSIDSQGGVLIFGDLAAGSEFGPLQEDVPMRVEPGDLIGFVSGAGVSKSSTGPHLHFEYWANGYKNGAPANPVELLLNWDSVALSGNLLPAESNPFFGTESGGITWNIEAVATIGAALNTVIEMFMKAANSAFAHLKPAVYSLILALCTIDLALPILLAGMAFSARDFVIKLIRYGALWSILLYWPKVIDTMLLGFVRTVSGTASGAEAVIAENISQPQLILQKCIGLIGPALNKISTLSGWDVLRNFSSCMMIYLLSVIIFFFFCWYAFYLTMVLCEFYISAALCAVTVPFSAWKLTKFIPEGSVGHLISSALKLLITSFVMCLVVLCIQQAKPTDFFSQTLETRVVSGSGAPYETYNSPYIETAKQIAIENGIPPDLFCALISAESSWIVDNPSPAGALGLGQLMEGTAREYGCYDRTDPVSNLTASAKYFKHLYDKFGSWEYAMVGYNGGEYSFDPANGIPQFGKEYIELVNSRLYGSYAVSNTLTSDQMTKFINVCLVCIMLTVVGVSVPKSIVRSMGGPVQLP